VAAGKGSLINLLRLTNSTIEVINNRPIPEAFRMAVATGEGSLISLLPRLL
jgi:hypothetical protein